MGFADIIGGVVGGIGSVAGAAGAAVGGLAKVFTTVALPAMGLLSGGGLLSPQQATPPLIPEEDPGGKGRRPQSSAPPPQQRIIPTSVPGAGASGAGAGVPGSQTAQAAKKSWIERNPATASILASGVAGAAQGYLSGRRWDQLRDIERDRLDLAREKLKFQGAFYGYGR